VSEAGDGGVTIRPPRPEEAAAVAELLNACSVDDIGMPDTDTAQMHRWWRQPGFDPALDAWVAETSEGRIVGYVQVESNGEGGDLQLDGYTHPAFMGRGIGTRLLDAAERRAARVASAHGIAPPVTVRHGAWAETPPTRFLRARGYAFVRCFFRMRIDLDGPPPAPAWPEGVRLEGFERGRDEHVFYDVIEEAFVDHWEHFARPFDDWITHRITEEPDFDASLWFRAVDGGETTGAAIARPRAAEEKDAGWVSDLAVRRPWRGRGIGRALLLHAFGALYERGARAVMLAVDADSPTGAVRLYEDVGMRVVRRLDVFEKALE
jgi:mycothiol synthase